MLCLCLTAALVALLPCSPAAAQDAEPAPPAEAAPAPPEAPTTDDQLTPLVRQLAERDGYEAAVEQLIAMGGDGVEAVFRHIDGRDLYDWQGRIVYIPEFTTNEAGESVGLAYPMITLPPVEGQPWQAEPIGEARKDDAPRFKEQRKARRPIRQALAVIGLYNPKATKRRAAAKTVGDVREASALAKLREIAVDDPDGKVRFLARESAALIVLAGNDPEADEAAVIAAAKELGELKSIRAIDMLEDLREAEGLSEADVKTVDAALARINRHSTTAQWISHTFRGFSLGTILVLIALGLAITFGLMGVINMAHGEMLMIGAIATWATFTVFAGEPLFSADSWLGSFLLSIKPADAWFDWYYIVAFPIAFGVAALAGLLTEVLVVRWLYKRPLDSLLATIGVSLIMIQGVRLWKGDNLGMNHPSWATGGWEVLQDVILPYNRLFLIGLSAFCLLSVFLLFRYTRIGLLIRATVQNREMAQALGVNTRVIDMFTFAFGAGLAGLAGYGLFLLSNPTPSMGQAYIVQAFQTVVVGGVGKLIGVVVSGLGIGFLSKYIEPLTDAGWSTVIVMVIVIIFIQRRPAGLFPDKGRMANQATGEDTPWLSGGKHDNLRDIILGGLFIFVGLIVIPGMYLTGMISPGSLNKYGQYLAFALVAIGLDLVWGYLGILSLCQALFFALGGYAMGFYLINHGPMDRYGVPEVLATVMSDVTDKQPPAYLAFFHTFPVTVILGILLSGGVAFIIGATCFRSRVRGVYFSILTQAILLAFWNVWVKQDMKLGGTDGLKYNPTETTILGRTIADKPYPKPEDFPNGGYLAEYAATAFGQTRFWLYITSFLVLAVSFVLVRMLVKSRFGRVMIAIRDDETRLRFIGYQTWVYKAAVFTIAGVLAGIGGMLYMPQKGIITPKFMEPFWSIMVVVWVALGGRGNLWGAVLGTIGVSVLYDSLTSGSPEWYTTFCEWLDFSANGLIPDGSWLQFLWSAQSWPIILGGLFILVTLVLPGGVMSIPTLIMRHLGRVVNGKPGGAL